MSKTKEQLEEQIRVEDRLKEERELSDKVYARKIAETLIFGFVGLALVAVVGAIIGQVIIK